MSLFKKIIAVCPVLLLSACGFVPLYGGGSVRPTVTTETADIFVDEIPDRLGQILRRALTNRLTPHGEPLNARYRLSVSLSDASIAEQGVRMDSLATRYSLTYTAGYTLKSYPEDKVLLTAKTIGRTNYDVQISPYATDVAEQKSKERVMEILGEDIALRIGAFFKSRQSEQTSP